MYPTMFTIPYLPAWLADIKSYGVMLMIAFLSGIWMACRRAIRSQANPDIVLNMGFIALFSGVLGARIMFVWHYWDTRFANQPNPFLAIFDLRAGGLEFWGGPILTIPCLIIYLRYIAKASVRWYLDISAPSLAWGLAVTRIGCFLNGCCWGSVCVDPHDHNREKAEVPWAVHFPYRSPAMIQQFHFGQLTLPKELIFINPSTGESAPIATEYIESAIKERSTIASLDENIRAAEQTYQEQVALNADKLSQDKLLEEVQKAKTARSEFLRRFPEIRIVEEKRKQFGITPEEMLVLTEHFRAKPAHPTQLYESISGFLLCLLLTVMFYYRRRHGIVLGWFLMLYSISRYLLEAIRQDNPLDVGGLTISQAISIGTFIAGLAMVVAMYLYFPQYSPRAIPFVLPDEPQAKPARSR